MKKTLKFLGIFALIIVAVISNLLIVSFLFNSIIDYSGIDDINKEDTYDYERANSYTKAIIDILKENDEFKFTDVFKFKWEKAYVIEEAYIGGDELDEALGINVDIEGQISDICGRIVFLKDDKLVYEYRYNSSSDFFISNVGVIISNDVKAKKVAHYPGSGVYEIEITDYFQPYKAQE